MAAPFERAFDDFMQRQEEASKFTRESAPEGVQEGGEVMAIHYRDEEAIYIKSSHDRVTVIFSTIFREETDRIFGKVFLQVCVNYDFDSWASAEMEIRNLSMRDGEPYKMLLRSSTATSHLWNFKAYAVCPTEATARSAT